MNNIDFNSHAHVERDKNGTRKRKIFQISTHTLTWSVTNKDMKVIEFTGDFNSHAHVERDGVLNVYHCRTTISTHTLTWSVTYPMQPFTKTHIISTHTLTWSVTKDLRSV